MNDNNPFETLKFPELHKNKIECIDKDKIPQEKIPAITKKKQVEWAKDLILNVMNATIFFDNELNAHNQMMLRKVTLDRMSDDDILDLAKKMGDAIHELNESKRKEGDVSFGLAATLSKTSKGENGELVVESLTPKSFSLIAQPLAPEIKERLCGELGIGEIPDDIAVQVRLCKTWLESKSFFAKPSNEMTDWEVLMLTTSCLTSPDDAAETYRNLVTCKDVEEATEAYETTSDNFNTIFGKQE